MNRRPDPTEYAPYYDTYVRLVDEGDLPETLARQIDGTVGFYRSVSEERAGRRYAAGKWSVKEVLGHVIDAERVFQYRAAAFARGEQQPLPGFDQDGWMQAAVFDERTWTSLVEELKVVRASTVALYRHLPPAAIDRRGTASGHPVSVRALGYIIAGHERHHLALLKVRYGLVDS